MLAVVGGHSFQDYTAYRDAALARLPEWDLDLGTDVVMLGTVSDADLAGWYRSADALAFPSLKEGWGLVVLEAMSAEPPGRRHRHPGIPRIPHPRPGLAAGTGGRTRPGWPTPWRS